MIKIALENNNCVLDIGHCSSLLTAYGWKLLLGLMIEHSTLWRGLGSLQFNSLILKFGTSFISTDRLKACAKS